MEGSEGRACLIESQDKQPFHLETTGDPGHTMCIRPSIKTIHGAGSDCLRRSVDVTLEYLGPCLPFIQLRACCRNKGAFI